MSEKGKEGGVVWVREGGKGDRGMRLSRKEQKRRERRGVRRSRVRYLGGREEGGGIDAPL